MAAWKIYRVIERGATKIPLTELMINGSLDFYPDVQSAGYFNFSLRGDQLVFLAGNHIGLIPLNSRIAIEVEPKTGRSNWLHIVGKARGTLKELKYLVEYSRTDTTSLSLLEFLSRNLLWQTEIILEKGLYRKYLAQRAVTPFPRGKIQLKQSMTLAWARGHTHSVAVEYYTLSTDTPQNRLLRYALDLASTYLLSLPATSPLLRKKLSDLQNLFTLVPFDSSLKYIAGVRASLERGSIPEVRSYYEEACSTALLLTEQAGIITQQLGAERTYSFAVNMENVFQDYCFRVLNSQKGLLGPGARVFLEPAGRIPLFTGTNCDKRNAEPDIVIENASNTKLPLEVKYKEDPNRVDINQAVAYGVAYSSSRVVIVCYAETPNAKGWLYLGKVGGIVDVWVYRIDINSSNIEQEETRFVEDISNLLNGRLVVI